MVLHTIKHFGLSVRKSCILSEVARSSYLYDKKGNNKDFIIGQIEDIVQKNNRYGCSMVHLKLRQKEIKINHKRTERIYKALNLKLIPKKGRKKIASEK